MKKRNHGFPNISREESYPLVPSIRGREGKRVANFCSKRRKEELEIKAGFG